MGAFTKNISIRGVLLKHLFFISRFCDFNKNTFFYRFLRVLSRRTSSLSHQILFPLQFRLDLDRSRHIDFLQTSSYYSRSFYPQTLSSIISQTISCEIWPCFHKLRFRNSHIHTHIRSFIDEDQPYIHLSPSSHYR